MVGLYDRLELFLTSCAKVWGVGGEFDVVRLGCIAHESGVEEE